MADPALDDRPDLAAFERDHVARANALLNDPRPLAAWLDSAPAAARPGRVSESRVLAHGTAYIAMAGRLERSDLNWLAATAMHELPEGDYLRAAVEAFVAAAHPVLCDPAAQRPLGEHLLHALRVAITPAVPGAERADVHG